MNGSWMYASLFLSFSFFPFFFILASYSFSIVHKELYKFAVYIMRKFAETAEVNPKIFVELLFWKTAREAAEIEVGYGNVQE